MSYAVFQNDQEALDLRAQAPANRKRLKEIEFELRALKAEKNRLEDYLYFGDHVRVHKGRPYWSPYGGYESIDGTRRADYTPRAVDDRFNVALRSMRDSGYFDEKTILKQTESNAKKLCLAWALDGERPS
jgi:hypothetical protein